MSQFSPRLLFLFSVVAVGLVGLCLRPIRSATIVAHRADGPDFSRVDSSLSNPLRIVAYGDMRFTDPQETLATNPKVRQWLVDKIAAENPDAVLLSGDVPWRGGQAGDYDAYRSETKVWRDDHLFIYPALGNHELSGDRQQGLENWWNAFPELRGRRWYSVQLGSSVYILNLDSNSSLLPRSLQVAWINSQLRHLPASIRFVFFNMHHPPVVDFQKGGDPSHNGRPNERALARILARSSRRSHARFIVVAGHIHNYEHFDKNGIIYLVSGGGGAKPRPVVRGTADLYQDTGFPNYHYLRFVVDGDKLEAAMIRVEDPAGDTPIWEEKDRFDVPAVTRPVTVSAESRR